MTLNFVTLVCQFAFYNLAAHRQIIRYSYNTISTIRSSCASYCAAVSQSFAVFCSHDSTVITNLTQYTPSPLRHADNTLFFYSWQSLVAPWNESYRCKNITVISVQHKHQHINTLSPKLQGFGISRIYSWIYWLKRMKVKWFYLLLNLIALRTLSLSTFCILFYYSWFLLSV